MDPFTGLGSTAVACARLGVELHRRRYRRGLSGGSGRADARRERRERCRRPRCARARRKAASRGLAGQAPRQRRPADLTSPTAYFFVDDVGFGGGLSTYSLRNHVDAPLRVTFTSTWRRRFDGVRILRVVAEHVVVARLGVDPLQRLVEIVLVDDGDAAGLLGDARAGCPATCARTRSTAADRPARRCRPCRPGRADRSCTSSTFERFACRVSSPSSRARSASVNVSLCFC